MRHTARCCLCRLVRQGLLWLLLTLTACLPPSLPPVVKIGLVAPFEGAERAIGYDAIYAARLAVREINAAGGAAGWRLELVAYDDQGDADLARSAARNLAVDPDVLAVIGHYRPASTAAAQTVYREVGLPLLVLGVEESALPRPETLPGAAAWSAAYRAVGPHTPEPDIYALPTYEALYAVAEALAAAAARGTPTRSTVAAALPEVERHGLLGTLRWRPSDDEGTCIFHSTVISPSASP